VERPYIPPPAAYAAPAKAIIPTIRAARVVNNNHLAFTLSSLREASNYTRSGYPTHEGPYL
jgi:hypothetical protein